MKDTSKESVEPAVPAEPAEPKVSKVGMIWVALKVLLGGLFIGAVLGTIRLLLSLLF